MSKRKTIAVVFHGTTTQARMQTYRIWYCAQVWERLGIDVRFVNGPVWPREADLVIPHIDLSVLPKEYRGMLRSEVPAVNRNVVDIRRRTFTKNLVTLDDDYDGPVIVKTDCNSGGRPERDVRGRQPEYRKVLLSLRRGLHVLSRIASTGSTSRPAYTRLIQPDCYPVYQSKREVPRCAFSNDYLIVEKYLPETDGRFFYTRCYHFFGNEGVAIRMRSEDGIVKGHEGVDVEFVPVDQRIESIRRAMGFDYGKFDYVIHDGQAVLLDINNTPTFGSAFSVEVRERICAQLANGISNWFPEEAH